MAAQLELGVDEIRLGGRAQLLEPRHLEPGEGLVGEVGERRPAPQPERLAQLRRASVRVLSPRLGDEPLEAAEVRLLGRRLEHVAGIAGDDHFRAERLAELRDVVLKCVLGRRRRLPAQSSSISSSVETTSPARSSSSASSARCFFRGSDTGSPSATTSSGPRIRNSSMCAL